MERNFLNNNSSRFLTSFNEIETFLRQQINLDGTRASFSTNLSTWNKKNYLLKDQYRDLIQYGHLRNAIVHQFHKNIIIAEPHESVVSRIEQLSNEICRPKKLFELFEKPVITASVNDRIGDVLKLFSENKISQIPILDCNRIVDVLNMNTIGWWAATHRQIIHEACIEDVLEHSKNTNNYGILPQNTILPEAVKLFRESYSKVNKGWFMEAILITTEGKNETPFKGIIVLEDLVDYLI